MTRLLSLAAGNLPDYAPVDVVNAAAAVGWPASGIWFDADSWTERTTGEVRDAFASTGLVPLDIEVIWIYPGRTDPNHRRLLEAGGAIGARNALVVSSDPDPNGTKRQFERLCYIAERNRLNLCLEFLPITEVKTLADALDIVRSVGHPRGRVLIDSLHLTRSGGSPELLAEVDPGLMSYAQICDAPGVAPEASEAGLYREAVDGRLLPGEGELPLLALLERLPDELALSPEIRSRQLREAYPEAEQRARVILEGVRGFLERAAP